MLTLAIVLSLATAGLHATWNVLVKTSGDPLRTSTRAVGSAVLIITPVVLVAWQLTGRPGLPGTAWLLAAVSAVAELAYYVFLSEAYRRGELSAVYPLARGTAPLLAVLAGVVVLGERPTGFEIAGILLLLAGILIARRPAGAGSATVPALLTGVCIATYTAIDKAGTTSALPWVYGYVLAVFTAALLVGWTRAAATPVWRSHIWGTAAAMRRWRLHVATAPVLDTNDIGSWSRSIGVGLMMTSSYFLVLIALSLAPVVVVAPARESAIVLVTIWGVWRMKERGGVALRLLGALSIVGGIVLLVVR